MNLVPIRIDELVPYEPSVIRAHLKRLTELLVQYGSTGHSGSEILAKISSPPPTVVRVGGEWLLVHGIHRCLLAKCLGAACVLCNVTDKSEKTYTPILEARLAAGMKGLNNIPGDEIDEDRGKRNLSENHTVFGMPLDPSLYPNE